MLQLEQNENHSPEVSRLMSFIQKSPTAWHAAEEIAQALKQKNFIELKAAEEWQLANGQGYFIQHSDGALLAFYTPLNNKINDTSDDSKEDTIDIPAAHWVGSHLDSPAFKLKPHAAQVREDMLFLDCEVYGGPILHSWLDRDLLIAGRLVVQKEDGTIRQQLFQNDMLVRIPQLAIHLNREVNEGQKLNSQTQLLPLLGLDSHFPFGTYLDSYVDSSEKILDSDLFLCSAEAPALCGTSKEMLAAPRLDDLAMAHASLEAFLRSGPAENRINGAVFFNHEEIGSATASGAAGHWFVNTWGRIVNNLSNNSDAALERSVSQSLFVSADMAHAYHPGWPDLHDAAHKVRLNKGPVIKYNAKHRYATNAASAAHLRALAQKKGIELQEFVSANHLPCGSTIGPAINSLCGVSTVDIGNPMLAMHSIRETTGNDDHLAMLKLLEAFWE
jgi:aspartyl aminopeptidase